MQAKDWPAEARNQDKTLPSASRRHWTNLTAGSSKFTKEMCMMILSYWTYSNSEAASSDYYIIHLVNGSDMEPRCVCHAGSCRQAPQATGRRGNGATYPRKVTTWTSNIRWQEATLRICTNQCGPTPKAASPSAPLRGQWNRKERRWQTVPWDSCLGGDGDRNILSVRQN